MARRMLPRAKGGGLHLPKPTTIVNKGSRQAPMLPSRAALNLLTKGDPSQRSLSQYAKMTPTGGAGLAMPYSSIIQEGEQPSAAPDTNIPALQDDTGE